MEISAPANAQEGGANVQQEDTLLQKEERRRKRRRARQQRMNEEQQKYGTLLWVASSVDVLVSSVIMSVAFLHAYRDNGVSLYCIGFQALSHALSSLLLALRYGDERQQPEEAPAGPEDGLLRSRRRTYLVREKLVSFCMGFVMLISSGALFLKAVRKCLYWNVWYLDHAKMDGDVKWASSFLMHYGIIVYGAQSALRGRASAILPNPCVGHSFITSFVTLSFFCIMGFTSKFETEQAWKVEPIMALVLATFILSEGLRILLAHWGDVDLKLDRNMFA
jgi:hypothetical protein